MCDNNIITLYECGSVGTYLLIVFGVGVAVGRRRHA